MAEVNKNDFESREYQTELLELAIKKNLILYLPTGSGKTFIATLLIKELGKVPNILSRTIEDGGKRTFFLVNTVALVMQQHQQISSQTILKVGKYSGDIGVDLWDKAKWLEEINGHQILVMTCQIFVDVLEKKVIKLNNVNLIVFDECHRGVSNHPMRQVMKNFKDVPADQQPRILGLTATLLNGNISPKKVQSEITTLENTFIAQIATSLNEEMVEMYSTNPLEKKVTYRENDTSGYCYQIRDRVLDNLKVFIEGVQVDEVTLPDSSPANARQIDSNVKKTNKRLKNVIEDIKVNMDDLGVFGGSWAALAHLVQMQQFLPNAQSETLKLLYQTITADCVYLRKKFEIEMNKYGMSEIDKLHHYSSEKVTKLFDIFKKFKTNDSAIVFVKRRFSAKILYYILREASKIDPRLKHVKSNFVVGYNIGNPFKDTRENYLQRIQNQKVMEQFNQNLLNVLFASNVVEEGVDIRHCNYVIMFDPPQDFRAYVQSKGRARDKDSKYIIMTSKSDNFESKYCMYREVEHILKQILYGGKSRLRTCPTIEELNEKLFYETPGLETYRPQGVNGPIITAISAISLLNRYFASLKTDKFTKLTPFWWIKEEHSKFKCILQLPMQSKVRGLVEGTWQKSSEDAKRSVALEACKKLHKSGELNDAHLLPMGLNLPATKINKFTPNIDDSEIFEEKIGENIIKVGTKKFKRSCDKKWADCLSRCTPVPDREAYLHIFDIKPVYTPPAENHRLKSVYEILCCPTTFALLSSKKLPKLATFPLYMSTGELEVSIKDAQPIILSKTQLEQIQQFHMAIFDNVLNVVKNFMLKDPTDTQNSYLIAPIVEGFSSELSIDWNVIQEINVPFPSSSYIPSKEERLKLEVTVKNYLGKVVSPWYRGSAQKYLVTDVCFDKSEQTTFPSEIYETYKDYFADKYKIEPLITQPLIEVRPLTSKLNFIKPRALTRQLKHKNKDDNEDYEVWLLPEFCTVYPLPGRYWLKAMLLPSVLHRISRLCMAEELRRCIVKKTSVGIIELPPGLLWNKLTEDLSLKKEEKSEKQQALTPLSLPKTYSTSKSTSQMFGTEEEPVDIERHLDTATLFDLTHHRHFVGKPLLGVYEKEAVDIPHSSPKRSVLKLVDPPPLKMLKNNTAGLGPQQVDVMQALTTASANDLVSCERLETLGDSFLKFVISLALFEAEPDWLEGHLTNLKGRIVGNKNLFYCGKKRNLGAMLEVQDFSPNEDWVSPGFCVEHSVQNVIRQAKLNPSCLYGVKVPKEERQTGKLSTATHDAFNDALFSAEDVIQPQNCAFINQQTLADKNVSDAVEAILGVYLKDSGIFGALAVMTWFGVTDPELCTNEIFTKQSWSPAKAKGDCNTHLLQPDCLEEILNYKFRDRCYMLEAVTHSSYTQNNITTCYQRLEFLGDALIDFLITVHIYEKCTRLSPGDLTDLRSALVNNITLASVSVRNQLHKFMLYRSLKFYDCMMRFVKHQEERNHVIDDDILFLFEENEVNIADSVDVPKGLGDIFEALIGAIYLDSGKNIDITWKIVYNLMREEIDNFHENIPKNHVRTLYESHCSPEFSASIDCDGAVMVTAEIYHNGKTMRFNGFGDNKKQAKRAAAKHALRFIHASSVQ